MTDSVPWRGVIAAIAAITIFGFAQSVSFPLIALLLERRGASETLIGLNAAAPALAMMALSPIMPALARRMGLAVFLVGALFLAAAALLAFALTESIAVWMVIRFFYGCSGAMLYYGSEYWIVALAPPALRGRIVGLYAVALSMGFALGPMMLSVLGVTPWAFGAAIIPTLLAAAPILAARALSPSTSGPDGEAGPPPWRFFRTDATLMSAFALFGAIEAGIMTLIPVWGLRTGLTAAGAAFLPSLLGLGNVALQLPLGWAADHMNRGRLLTLCAAGCLVSALLLPFAAGTAAPLYALLFVAGGVAAGLYTVALIDLGARHTGAMLRSANAAVLLAYGAGALAGPPFAGEMMRRFGPDGLAAALALLSALWLIGAGALRRKEEARFSA